MCRIHTDADIILRAGTSIYASSGFGPPGAKIPLQDKFDNYITEICILQRFIYIYINFPYCNVLFEQL